MAARDGIGVVVNPHAGRMRRDPRAVTRFSRIVGDHGVVAESHRIDDLPRIAEDFQRQGIDVVAISGGDGTASATLTGFRGAYEGQSLPRVALLRGGTMNTVANALGVTHGRPEGLLERLVARYARREPLREVLPGTMDVGGRLGFLFGLGVLRSFLAEYYAFGPRPTTWTAVKTLARGVGSVLVGGAMAQRLVQPVRVALVVDGQDWGEREYLGVAGGTIDQIGLGFRPFHLAPSHPDAFHFLAIHGSASIFVRDLPRIHRAEGMRPRTARDAVAHHVELRIPGGGPVLHMVDGDLVESPGPLVVRAGPRVRVIA